MTFKTLTSYQDMRKVNEDINPKVEVTLNTGDPIILFTSSVGAVYFIQQLDKRLDTANNAAYKLVHAVNPGTYTMREMKYGILTYQTTHQKIHMLPDTSHDIFYIQMFEHYQVHPNYGAFVAYGVWRPRHHRLFYVTTKPQINNI